MSCHQREDDIVADVKKNNKTTNSALPWCESLRGSPLTGRIANQEAMTELVLTDACDAYIKASNMEVGQGCL